MTLSIAFGRLCPRPYSVCFASSPRATSTQTTAQIGSERVRILDLLHTEFDLWRVTLNTAHPSLAETTMLVNQEALADTSLAAISVLIAKEVAERRP